MTTAIQSTNGAIETLTRRYGASFQGILPQQKALLAAILLAHVAKAGDTRISIEQTIKAIDRDELLGSVLPSAIVQFCKNCDTRELAELAMLLAARHVDDIAAGAYGR